MLTKIFIRLQLRQGKSHYNYIRAYVDYTVLKCYKCCAFGHSYKNFKNKNTVGFKFSSVNHLAKNCKHEAKKCINCTNSIIQLYIQTFVLKIKSFKAEKSAKELNKIYSFSIIHCNIRSLNKNYEDLLIYLEETKVKSDAIILSETWEVQKIEMYSNDYIVCYSDKGATRSDRTVVYVKSQTTHNNLIMIDNSPLIEIKILQNQK